MKNTKNGEILTLMTIAVMVIIAVVTVVSTTFLRSSKNKIAMNSRASFTCEDDPCARPSCPGYLANGCAGPKDTPVPETPAPATPAPATPAPTTPPSGNEVTKTDVNIAPTLAPLPKELPGDADKWKCPGPACDKCGYAGWWGAGCGEFVASKPKDAPYAAYRAVGGTLSSCGGAQLQCSGEGSKSCMGADLYTCGNDGCLRLKPENANASQCTTDLTDAKGNKLPAGAKVAFSQQAFNACLQKNPSKTPEQCRQESIQVAVPTTTTNSLPFATFKKNLCGNCETGCDTVPGGNGLWACREDLKQFYPSLMEKEKCTSSGQLTSDKYGNYYRCDGSTWKSIAPKEASITSYPFATFKKNLCGNCANGVSDCESVGNGLYACREDIGAYSKSKTENTPCTENNKIQRDSYNNYYNCQNGSWQSITPEDAKSKLATQAQADQLTNDCVCVDGHYTGGACSQFPGSNLYSCLNNTRYPDLAQQMSKQKLDQCTASCNSKKGSCISKPDGSMSCVEFTSQQTQAVQGKNIPLINIFGQSIGSWWGNCGGEDQIACNVSTGDLGTAITTPGKIKNEKTCATGLKLNAVGFCVRDPEYDKSMALANYLQQNPNLKPEELDILLQQNLTSTKKYLPDVAKNICGTTCNGQCVYSATDSKFTCVKTSDVINYYANLDKDQKGKPGQLEGSCYGLFGNPTLFGSCDKNLDCNNNGTCQISDKVIQAAAIQLTNKNNYVGQTLNLQHLVDVSKLNDVLTDQKLTATLACGSSSPQYVNGSVVQCTDTDNKYVRQLPQTAITNPQYFSVVGDACRSLGGFCANDAEAGDKGNSDCPSGYSCHSNPAPNTTTRGEYKTGIAFIDIANTLLGNTSSRLTTVKVSGLGGNCESSANGTTSQCVKGLRCWDYKCQDVTQLAYNPDYAKGFVATEMEKNPIAGIGTGLAASLNFDGMTNATNVQAQVFQDQMKKINQSNVTNADTVYKEYYASLPSAVKGKVINLSWQELSKQNAGNPIPVIDGLGTAANWLRERGADTGLFVGAYSSTFSNPYVETGESWSDPNASTEKKLLDLGRSVAATVMPVVDVVSVGGGALVEKAGSSAVKIAGESLIKRGAADIATEGILKGGWAILKDQGLKDGAITLGRVLPEIALTGAGKTTSAVARGAIILTEVSSKPFEGVIGLAAPIITAPIHGPAVWTAKMVGNGLKALGEHGVPILSKFTDKSIITSVSEDVVAKALAKGEVLTGQALTAASDQALAQAKKQGFHGLDNVFRAEFEKTANRPPPNIIQATLKGVDPGLVDIALQKGSNLRGTALDEFIRDQVGRRATAIEKVPEEIAKVKGALQAVDFAQKWGFKSPQEIQGAVAALTKLGEGGNPVIREQAEDIFQKALANAVDSQGRKLSKTEIAAKSQTAVAGLLLDKSPYVVTAQDFLKGVSKDTAKKIASVQDTAEFQDLLSKGGFDKSGDYHFTNPKNPSTQLTLNLNDTDISELQKSLIRNNAIDPFYDKYFAIDDKFIQNFNNQSSKTVYENREELTQDILDYWSKNGTPFNKRGLSTIMKNPYTDQEIIAQAKAYTAAMVKDGSANLEKTGISGLVSNAVERAKQGLTDLGDRFKRTPAQPVSSTFDIAKAEDDVFGSFGSRKRLPANGQVDLDSLRASLKARGVPDAQIEDSVKKVDARLKAFASGEGAGTAGGVASQARPAAKAQISIKTPDGKQTVFAKDGTWKVEGYSYRGRGNPEGGGGTDVIKSAKDLQFRIDQVTNYLREGRSMKTVINAKNPIIKSELIITDPSGKIIKVDLFANPKPSIQVSDVLPKGETTRVVNVAKTPIKAQPISQTAVSAATIPQSELDRGFNKTITARNGVGIEMENQGGKIRIQPTNSDFELRVNGKKVSNYNSFNTDRNIAGSIGQDGLKQGDHVIAIDKRTGQQTLEFYYQGTGRGGIKADIFNQSKGLVVDQTQLGIQGVSSEFVFSPTNDLRLTNKSGKFIVHRGSTDLPVNEGEEIILKKGDQITFADATGQNFKRAKVVESDGGAIYLVDSGGTSAIQLKNSDGLLGWLKDIRQPSEIRGIHPIRINGQTLNTSFYTVQNNLKKQFLGIENLFGKPKSIENKTLSIAGNDRNISALVRIGDETGAKQQIRARLIQEGYAIGDQTSKIEDAINSIYNKLHEVATGPNFLLKADVSGKVEQRIVSLNTYVDGKTDRAVEEAIALAQKRAGGKVVDADAINVEIRTRAQSTRQYFVTPSQKSNGKRPVDVVEEIFDGIQPKRNFSSPIAQAEYDKAVNTYKDKVLQFAYDQQLENPEQFVSHGFDHTLSVLDYTKKVLANNPDLINAAMSKYGISKEEAQFMFESVAVFHDFGYPLADELDLPKAAHAVASAFLASDAEITNSLKQVIKSSGADINTLINDFRDSILFHGADKVEAQYTAKIVTTKGTFLTDVNNISQATEIVSQFTKGSPTRVVEIHVSSQGQAGELRSQLQDIAGRLQSESGVNMEMPNIIVTNQTFGGRSFVKNPLVGLEFSSVDAINSPLQAVIRVADNMDMRINRLSDIQRTSTFRDIYFNLGDTREPTAQILSSLESLSSSKDPGALNKAKKIYQDAINGLAGVSQDDKDVLLHYTQSWTSPSDAENAWKDYVINTIITNSKEDLPLLTKQRIYDLGMVQNSISLRHFGGTEAITDISLKGNVITVKVDSKDFAALNQIRVQEKNINGAIEDIGVGEYQIWRTVDAYSSISVKNKNLVIKIIDENGKTIKPTYHAL